MKMNRLVTIFSVIIVGLVSAGWVVKDTANPIQFYTGSNTTPSISAATSGLVTLGPTTGTLQHVIQAGQVTVDLKSLSAGGSGAVMTFAASGNGQTGIIGVSSAGGFLTDAAQGDLFLRTGNDIRFSTNSGTSSAGKITSNTGAWTIGPATGTVSHVIQGGSTTVDVKSLNATTSAYMTFAASGAGQSAIVGACSANALIGDAAEGDMCLRTGNDMRFSANSGGSSQGRLSPGGVWFNAAGTWTVSSDKRLKKNIVTMEGALARINALHPVTFDWIEDKPTNRPRAGFIAQEVETTFPGMVKTSEHTYTKDGQPITLKDAKHLDLGSEMFANLVQAIQEQQHMIYALQQEVTQLKHNFEGVSKY